MPTSDAPILNDPIIDRARLPGEPFAFRLHPDTFADPKGDDLAISIAMADGSDLPDWLSFDGKMFRGEAPADFDDVLDIRVTASDGSESVSDDFRLTIGPDAPVLIWDVGRGVNLGNALDAPNEGDWGYILTEDHVEAVAAEGFDTVRLPVRWSNHTDANDIIDEDFFQRVEEVMGWALDRGLQVIVNQHHFDRPIDGTHEQVLKTLWDQIATRFADMPDSVYFELYNEPHGDFQGPEAFDTLAEVLKVVRETNPTRAVVIGGDDWSSVRNLLGLELPNDDYVVPTIHYYVPFAFTHQGAHWINNGPPLGYDWGSAMDLARLDDDFEIIATFREENGDMPFYMGEFGVYPATPPEERAQWAQAVRDKADEAGIAWTWWGFHTIYDVYNNEDGWTEEVLDVLKVPVEGFDPDNSAPDAVGEAVEGAEDSVIEGQVSATDPDDDPLTFSKASNPTHGEVIVQSDGRYSYTPDADFFGSDSFTIRADDGRGGRDDALVTVTVTPVNDPAVAADSAASVVQNGQVSGTLPGTDPDGDPLAFALTTAPTKGDVTVNPDGSWTYTPDADVTGADSFGFSVTDPDGPADTGTIALTITDPPPPYTIRAGTDGDDRLDGGNGRDLFRPGLGNDKIFAKGGDDIVAFQGGSDRAEGGGGADLFVITPAFLTNGRQDKAKVVDYEVGVDRVDLGGATIRNVVEQSNRVILTLNTGDILELIGVNRLQDVDFVVADPNAAPVVQADAPEGPEDSTINGQVTATDADGDVVTFTQVSNPTNGTVTVAPDGSYTYTPNPDFNGTGSFEVEGNDGNGGTDRVTVNVSVTPVNDAPEASPDAPTGQANAEIAGRVTATDADGDVVTFSKASDPENGSVVVSADGRYTYTPTLDFIGTDAFDVLADDGAGGTDRVTVMVAVTAPNTPPVAMPDDPTGSEDAQIFGQVTASDADGDAVTFSKASDPDHGAVTVEDDGSYAYTSDPNFHGQDSFDVLAADGKGGTDVVTVTVTVTSVNDDPLAIDADVTVTAGEATGGLLAATDADDDPLTFALSDAPEKGEATVDADGTWIFTPDDGATGADSFTFTVRDGTDGIDTGLVTIDIQPEQTDTFVRQTGTDDRDLMSGANGQDDAIFGGAGNDQIKGLSGNDFLNGGSGDDKLFGGADDDILAFDGNGNDRANGDSGADTFVLTDILLTNGQSDKVKIVDYMAGVDAIDLGGAQITQVTQLSKRLVLEVGADGDVVELLNFTNLNAITFVDDTPLA